MPATQAAVDSLWDEYLTHRDVAVRNTLVERYASLVHEQAMRLARRLPPQVGYDELCSAGYDGLIEAVESYDPARKTRFETFCRRRVLGAVWDWLREVDQQSRMVRLFEKQVNAISEEIVAALGRPPTDQESADRLGLPLSRFRKLRRQSQLGRAVHISALQAEVDPSGDGICAPWDIADTRESGPGVCVARRMLAEYLMRGLGRQERLILMLYYFEGMTMEEIGQTLAISESRVSQIHKEILMRLRARLAEIPIEDLIPA